MIESKRQPTNAREELSLQTAAQQSYARLGIKYNINYEKVYVTRNG